VVDEHKDMGSWLIVFLGEAMEHHQLIEGWGPAGGRDLLNLGLRLQIDRYKGLVLKSMAAATEG